MITRELRDEYQVGFSTQNLKHFKYKGHWTSLKTKLPTNSYKVVFKDTLTFCAPSYTYNKEFNQFRLSNRHNFWVMISYELFKKLDLHGKGFKYHRLIKVSAKQLMELINLILYIKRAKRKQQYHHRELMNGYNYKDESKYNFFTNLLLKLNEKLINWLSQFYIIDNFWKLTTCENLIC